MKKLSMFIFIMLFTFSVFATERNLAFGEYLVFFDKEGKELHQPIHEEEEAKETPPNISLRIEKRPHDTFRNNWSGFELGYNGLVGDDLGDFDLYWKSVNVRLNLFQKNLITLKNQFGVYTGLGFSWDNYRFNTDKVLVSEPGGVIFVDEGIEYNKNKLALTYLNVPLLVEWQTLSPQKFKRFHIAGGINVGWLMKSHTKQMIKNGGREKFKNRDDFYINPFRYDLTLRIGIGNINLYGTYALNNIFESGKGPDLTQYSFGIRLLNL